MYYTIKNIRKKVSPYLEKDADPFSNKTLVATATQY